MNAITENRVVAFIQPKEPDCYFCAHGRIRLVYGAKDDHYCLIAKFGRRCDMFTPMYRKIA